MTAKALPDYRYDLGDIVSCKGRLFAITGRQRDARDGMPTYDLRQWDGSRKSGPIIYVGQDSLDDTEAA